MFLRLVKGAFLMVTSVVIVPYTLAVVTNILYGWPQGRNKYRRALSPRKVFGLNYAALQMVRDKSKFVFLYLRWKRFYRNADPRMLYKNVAYGRNDCTLDVYLPGGRNPDANMPVIIFVHGGGWKAGDKKDYGLLGYNISVHTKTVVVCPSYSTYPKGYVDDMIQDIVDCISWVIDNIQEYGGDKDKIILMGHSAGAHLASMSILELLYDERLSVQPSFRFQPSPGGPHLDELAFAESHYGRMPSIDKTREGLEDSSGSSESFAVVSENGASATDQRAASGSLESSAGAVSLSSDQMDSSTNSQGFVTVDQSLVAEAPEEALGSEEMTEETADAYKGAGDSTEMDLGEKKAEESDNGDAPPSTHSDGSQGDDEEEHDDESGDDDSVVTVRPKDIDRHATLIDMSKSVKAFIGLSGIYSIGDHYKHEIFRCVEDISVMWRAHYGEDHFARFSPKEIITNLGRSLSLPLMVLVHGGADYINKLSGTLEFADVLSQLSSNVKVKVIPECPHYDICLDLMDSNRRFYAHVMNIVMETVKAVS